MMCLIPLLPECKLFNTKHSVRCKVYANESGIKQLNHSLSTCSGDNPLSKAWGLSPHAGKQTITVELQWLEFLWDHENLFETRVV